MFDEKHTNQVNLFLQQLNLGYFVFDYHSTVFKQKRVTDFFRKFII